MEMARDDDKPEAGDDPWAGLEAQSHTDSEPDFTFSFDDDAASSGAVSEELVAEQPVIDEPLVADAAAQETRAEELAADEFAFGDPDGALDALLDDGLEAAPDAGLDSLLAAESPLDADGADPDVIPAADAFGGGAAEAAADADIDDWLNSAADGEASASSVLAAGVFQEPVDAVGLPDVAAGESTVSIGTGTSGIASPSGIEALSGSVDPGESDLAASGDESDPFAGLTAETGDWPSADAGESGDAVSADAGDDMFSFMGQPTSADGQDESPFATASDAELPADASETAADFGSGFEVGAGVAAAGAAAATVAGGDDAKRGPAKAKRPAPPKKRKPSVIGQLIGVVIGGAMAIPVSLAILIWGFGKDPFNLTPMLPDSVAFLLPAKFRPAGSDTIPNAPSLDDIVGGPAAGDGEAALPNGDDPPMTAPEQPAPVEPEPTDLAVVDPAPGPGETADDPLMNLLEESGTAVQPPAPVEPPPPPEPEPLDLEKLGAAVAEATAALEAVAAVDDPSDPVRRRLLALWYKSLAGYAEELASLERLASETGRPFEPAVEQGDAIRTSLANHPRLLAELSGLTRAWITYSKRPSDGVMTPATFVEARRVGPYWRSQVRLAASETQPAREMVVLTRAEPAVTPGDEVVITGLAVDDDVVWASELRPAAGGSGFPGL